MVAYFFALANLRCDFDRMEESLVYGWSFVQDMEGNDVKRGHAMNKFLLTYTEYNTAVWVHAYGERAFQLANTVLALGVPEDERRNIKLVTESLKEKGHRLLLHHLQSLREESPSKVGEALKRRNDFIHRMPEQAWQS